MKKIIIAILFIVFAFNYQSCKVLKKTHKSKTTVDSTSKVQQRNTYTSTISDSAKETSLLDKFQFSKNTDLSIGKISETEEETTPVNTRLVFNVDSIKCCRDTVATTARDGTKLRVYKDVSGQTVADVQRPGKRKRTLELQNVTLKTSNNLDSSKAAIVTSSSRHQENDSSIHTTSSTQVLKTEIVKNKDVKKSFGLLKWLGLAALATGIVFAVYKLNKKYSIKTKLISWLKGILTGV